MAGVNLGLKVSNYDIQAQTIQALSLQARTWTSEKDYKVQANIFSCIHYCMHVMHFKQKISDYIYHSDIQQLKPHSHWR